MSIDKKCPYCGEINRNLDLSETDGLFVCSSCNKLVDTKQVKQEESDEKQEQ